MQQKVFIFPIKGGPRDRNPNFIVYGVRDNFNLEDQKKAWEQYIKAK